MKRAIGGVAMVMMAAAGCNPESMTPQGPGTVVCVSIDATGGTSEIMGGDECSTPRPGGFTPETSFVG